MKEFTNNIFMQSLWFIPLAVFLVFLIVPVKITIKMSYNLLKNRGVLGFGVLWFKQRIASFKFENFVLKVKSRSSKKQTELEFKIDPEELAYIKRMLAQFRDKLKVRNMQFEARVGTADAMQSALMSGAVSTLFLSFFVFVKNFKQTSSLKVKTKTEFNKELFNAKLVLEVSISVFDMAYCLIYALLTSKRRKKDERQIFKRKLGGEVARHEH